jgi:type III pantothenate kinase
MIALAQNSGAYCVTAARCLSAIVRCRRVAKGRQSTVAIVAFALTLIGAGAGAARAQDAVESGSSKSSSSWERVDSVLEVPPVYRPNSSAPADGCAEDCSGSITPGAGEAPVAVPGSADNTSNASAGTADTLTDESASADDSESDDSAPDDTGSRQKQAAAGIARQGADAPVDSAASVQGNDQNHDEQQAEADRGDYAIQEPPMIIVAPIGSYAGVTALPAPIYSGAPIPSPAFPSSSWMPRPVPGLAPLPSTVPSAGGGFGGGFPRMPGFAIGLGQVSARGAHPSLDDACEIFRTIRNDGTRRRPRRGDGNAMLVAIDVGNTDTVIGIYEGEGLLHHWRLSTKAERTTDEHGVMIGALLQSVGLEPPLRPEGVAIACVVPPLNRTMEDLAHRYFQREPLIVGPGIKTGMPILYENPKEVGADRIVNAVAAYDRYGSASIVVDFGTATTFDYVTARGEYVGGAIAPGLGISMDALVKHAAKLYEVELVRPREAVGRTTIGAIQSGLIFGYTALVDGLVERIEQERGEHARVVATGGLASLIAPESRTIEVIDEFLTLKGLRLIFERNRRAPAPYAPGNSRDT